MLKTQKNKIWYSQCDAVAVVIGDWELRAGDEIPHDGNEPIDCIQLLNLDWCPQGGHICSSFDGAVLPMDFAIRKAGEAIDEPIDGIHEHHAYLVGGQQPDVYIINPRVIAKIW